jgi:hypothetical protein
MHIDGLGDISPLPLPGKEHSGRLFSLVRSCTDKSRRYMSVLKQWNCLFLVDPTRMHASLHEVLGDHSDLCRVRVDQRPQ